MLILKFVEQLAANYRRRKDIYTLPKADQELLSRLGYKQKLDEVDKAIEANAKFLSLIVKDANLFGGDDDDDTVEADESCTPGPTHSHGEGTDELADEHSSFGLYHYSDRFLTFS